MTKTFIFQILEEIPPLLAKTHLCHIFMKCKWKMSIICAIFIIQEIPVKASDPVTDYNDIVIVERHFMDETIEKYQTKYDYDISKTNRTLFQHMKERWQNLVNWISRQLSAKGSFEMITLIAFLIAIVTLIYHFSKSNRTALTTKTNRDPMINMVEGIDIHDEHEIIKDAILQAENRADFRQAIRLHYIHCIKLLIEQRKLPGQTQLSNSGLLREITDPSLKESLKQLIRFFEYTWYGSYSITSEKMYNKVKNIFVQFKERIPNRIEA